MMPATTYRIVLHKKALAELRELPVAVRAKIKVAIDGLTEDPRPASAAKLRGQSAAYRLRFGAYRLLYEVHATEVVFYVIGIAHRKEVYRRLLRRR